ncbi:MAG: lytic transglycosylase [Gammaproteobacteria bacterium]|nr:lytic transglycosylase [Gammaproteobacteria bacterium]
MNYRNVLLAGLLTVHMIPALAAGPTADALRWRHEAQRFQQGSGVQQDFRKAYQHFCKAALAGDAESAFNLGWLYLSGQGVTRHPGRARTWFEQARQLGNPHGERMAFRLRTVAGESDSGCRQPNPAILTAAAGFGPPRIIRPSNKQIESLVQQVAARYAIDPQLVLAVMQAESGFNPGALSPKNAQGLMQLIPATAERFGVKNAWDPAENIRGGAAYLHWLMRHFSGKVEWVLAAYNAGENSVERYKGIPPYAETQAYVKKILSHYGKLTHPVPPERPGKAL